MPEMGTALMFLLDTLYLPPRSQRDLEGELKTRIHDSQAALLQATDVNREAASDRLAKALREFTTLIFSETIFSETIIGETHRAARRDPARPCYDAGWYEDPLGTPIHGGDAVEIQVLP